MNRKQLFTLIGWIILTLTLSWIVFINFPWFVAPIVPVVMGLLFTILWHREKPWVAGFGWPGGFNILLCFVVPTGMGLLTSLIALMLGAATFDSANILPAFDSYLGLTRVSYELNLMSIIIGSLFLLISNILLFSLVFEEYGWRGYLMRKLHEYRVSPVLATVGIGIVWWAFHLPIYGNAMIAEGKPWVNPLQILNFIFFSSFINWMYLRTHSLWAAGIPHAIWNYVNILLLGDPFFQQGGGILQGELWLINGETLLGTLGTGAFGLLFLYLLWKGIGYQTSDEFRRRSQDRMLLKE
jgi:membrane protease YdiL (CAAX protease family)